MSNNLNFQESYDGDNDVETITHLPADETLSREDSEDENNEGTNEEGNKALEKIKNTNKMGPLQLQSKSKYTITKELAQVSNQKEKHIQANKEFLNAAQLKLPDDYFATATLQPEPAFSDEAKKIIESIPPIAWGAIFIFLSLLVYLSVDAFTNVLIAVGICVLTCYSLNSWLSNVKIQSVAERNTSKDNTIKALNEINTQAIAQLDNNVLQSHALTLRTVENVQNIRADVEKFHIKAVDVMHERETIKDTEIQKMKQLGLTERVKLNTQAARDISTIKSNTEITVKNIDADIDKARTQANQLMEGNRLKNVLDLKQLETKTQQEIKQMDINFQTLDANLKADVEKARVNANKETSLEKDRNETERYQIGQNADVEKTKSKHKVQIEEARQETARVEAKENNSCIIS